MISKTRELGCNQQGVLRALRRHGGCYYQGCGWLWGCHSGTVAILASLVRRGFVKVETTSAPEGWNLVVWSLADEVQP